MKFPLSHKRLKAVIWLWLALLSGFGVRPALVHPQAMPKGRGCPSATNSDCGLKACAPDEVTQVQGNLGMPSRAWCREPRQV